MGQRIHKEASWLGGQYRPSRMVEPWVVLPLYSGGRMDDLACVSGRESAGSSAGRGLLDATTFGRWLRRDDDWLSELLDALLWQIVRFPLGGPRGRILCGLIST